MEERKSPWKSDSDQYNGAEFHGAFVEYFRTLLCHFFARSNGNVQLSVQYFIRNEVLSATCEVYGILARIGIFRQFSRPSRAELSES